MRDGNVNIIDIIPKAAQHFNGKSRFSTRKAARICCSFSFLHDAKTVTAAGRNRGESEK